MKTLWVLEGPTGVGKTALAIAWAQKLQTEIVSADSRQFYHELQIGVARPTSDELKTVTHHFIASKTIHEYYSVSNYEKEALLLLKNLFFIHDHVVLTGGSGLYVQALCEGIDDLPDADPLLRKELIALHEKRGIEALRQAIKIADPVFYQEADLCNPVRLRRALEVCYLTGKPYSSFRQGKVKERPFEIRRYALDRPRKELYNRINQRVNQMIEEGLEKEAQKLYPFRSLSALQTVGYREWFDYFEGRLSLPQVSEEIAMHTRQYAKRQLTWIRHKTPCIWLNLSEKDPFFPLSCFPMDHPNDK